VAGSKARGEFTIIVRGASHEPVSVTDDEIRQELLNVRGRKSMTLRDAVDEVVRKNGLSRKRVYDIALKAFAVWADD
jgi:16S rRNA C1402 (ribose-2'-O) methylase RsmI